MFEETESIAPSIFAAMNDWFTPTVFFVLLNVVIATIALTSTMANQNQQLTQQQPDQIPPKLARSPSVLQRLRSINFRSLDQQLLKSNTDSDSDSTFNLDPQNLDYIFRQEDFQETEIQSVSDRENVEKIETHYASDRKNSEKIETHYVSDRKNAEKIETHYVSDREHVEKMETQFVSDRENAKKIETHDEKFEETQAQFDFPAAGEEELPEKPPAKMKKSLSMTSAASKNSENDDVELRRPATMKERATEVDEGVDAKADDFINKFRQQLHLQRVERRG